MINKPYLCMKSKFCCVFQIYLKFSSTIRPTFLEDQLASLICCIEAHILLKVCVLMVVDPHTVVTGQLGQVGYQAGLTHGCLTLDQNWESPRAKNWRGWQVQNTCIYWLVYKFSSVEWYNSIPDFKPWRSCKRHIGRKHILFYTKSAVGRVQLAININNNNNTDMYIVLFIAAWQHLQFTNKQKHKIQAKL